MQGPRLRKSGQPEPAAPARSRVWSLAERLNREGKLEELEGELRNWGSRPMSGEEEKDWYKASAALSLRQGKASQAFESTMRAFQKFPEDRDFVFILGRVAEARGQTEAMLRAWEGMLYPAVTVERAFEQAHCCQLWDLRKQARSFLRPLLDRVFAGKSADPSFLRRRGLPEFEDLWFAQAGLLLAEGERSLALEFHERAKSELAHFDPAFADAAFLWLEKEDSRGLRPLLRARDKAFDHQPPADLGLWKAAVEARLELGLDGARKKLDGVPLKPGDPAWLRPMRLLALADHCRRLGLKADEAGYLDQLWKACPGLPPFEQAFRFGLWRYLDELKKEYRAGRRRAG